MPAMQIQESNLYLLAHCISTPYNANPQIQRQHTTLSSKLLGC